MIAVADTSCIVAYINKRDVYHSACIAIADEVQAMLVPQTVLTEVAYLLQQRIGSLAVASFLESFESSVFVLVALEPWDMAQAAKILREYADSRIDFVDATVMAVADRLTLATVHTLDHRDFSIYRPKTHFAFHVAARVRRLSNMPMCAMPRSQIKASGMARVQPTHTRPPAHGTSRVLLRMRRCTRLRRDVCKSPRCSCRIEVDCAVGARD